MRHLMLMLAALAACGCGGTMPPIPQTLEEHKALQASHPDAYPQQTIVLHNLQRVLDVELQPQARIASMQVVTALGGGDPSVRAQISGLLADPKTPAALQQEALGFLLTADEPDLAAQVQLVVVAAGGLGVRAVVGGVGPVAVPGHVGDPVDNALQVPQIVVGVVVGDAGDADAYYATFLEEKTVGGVGHDALIKLANAFELILGYHDVAVCHGHWY